MSEPVRRIRDRDHALWKPTEIVDRLGWLTIADAIRSRIGGLESFAGHVAAGLDDRSRDRLNVATLLGFGPRFLHSRGRFHEGGSSSVVWGQVVDERRKVGGEIPGKPYTSGRVNLDTLIKEAS